MAILGASFTQNVLGDLPSATQPVVELDEVLDRLDRSRASIPPLVYTYRTIEEVTRGDKHRKWTTNATVARDAQSRRTERAQTLVENGREVNLVRSRTLVSPRTYVYMNFEEPVIREWMFGPGQEPSQDAKDMVLNFEPADLLLWGYGTGSRTLRDLREMDQARLEAHTPVGAGDSSQIEVDFYRSESGKERLVSRFLVDPSRGFAITGVTTFDAKDKVIATRKIEMREVKPNVWVPAAVAEDVTEPERRSTRIQVTNVRLFDPETDRFDLAALKPTEGAHVIHVDKDGQVHGYVVHGGISMPLEVDAELRK